MKKLSFALPFCFAVFIAAANCGEPQYPQCETDAQCADHNEFCVQGQCKECGSDEHCKDGFMCRENACVPKPECTADSECSGSCMSCEDEKCVPQCKEDRHCGAGSVCNDGCCQKKEEPEPECRSDADCSEDQRCSASKCVAAPQEAACEMVNVAFDFNDFSLNADARSVLDSNIECIKKYSGSITISGHADERGTEEYNLHLGEKRANAVKRYLIKMGVPESKLKSISFGEERPLDPGHNESAWSANRRVEFAK